MSWILETDDTSSGKTFMESRLKNGFTRNQRKCNEKEDSPS